MDKEVKLFETTMKLAKSSWFKSFYHSTPEADIAKKLDIALEGMVYSAMKALETYAASLPSRGSGVDINREAADYAKRQLADTMDGAPSTTAFVFNAIAIKAAYLAGATRPYIHHEVENVQEAAQAHADKVMPFVWPKNKHGEEIEQRVGQNPPNSRKHKNEQQKIVNAFLAGHAHKEKGESDAVEVLKFAAKNRFIPTVDDDNTLVWHRGRPGFAGKWYTPSELYSLFLNSK